MNCELTARHCTVHPQPAPNTRFVIYLQWSPPTYTGPPGSRIDYYTWFVTPPPSTYGLSTPSSGKVGGTETSIQFATATTSAVSPRTYQFSLTATNSLGYTSQHSEVTLPVGASIPRLVLRCLAFLLFPAAYCCLTYGSDSERPA